jgi:hypothetical protein
LITLFLSVVGQLLSFLHFIKVIKTQAEVAELKRRIETAIRKADSFSADAVGAKDQHKSNMETLEEKRKTAWPEAPETKLPTTIKEDPNVLNPRIVTPKVLTAQEEFMVSFEDLPKNTIMSLFCDRWKVASISSEPIKMNLQNAGNYLLEVKRLDATVIASRKVAVQSRKPASRWSSGRNG